MRNEPYSGRPANDELNEPFSIQTEVSKQKDEGEAEAEIVLEGKRTNVPLNPKKDGREGEHLEHHRLIDEVRGKAYALLRRVSVEDRWYRWYLYKSVFDSLSAVRALCTAPKVANSEADAAHLLGLMMRYGFIERVSKKADEFTGLTGKHLTHFKVSNHTFYRFKPVELLQWQVHVEVLQVEYTATEDSLLNNDLTLRLEANGGQSHTISLTRLQNDIYSASAGDRFIFGIDNTLTNDSGANELSFELESFVGSRGIQQVIANRTFRLDLPKDEISAKVVSAHLDDDRLHAKIEEDTRTSSKLNVDLAASSQDVDQLTSEIRETLLSDDDNELLPWYNLTNSSEEELDINEHEDDEISEESVRVSSVPNARIRLKLYATRQGSMTTAERQTLRRDLETRTWHVFVRIGEVRGAHCSIPIVIKSQVVLDVGAKVIWNTEESKQLRLSKWLGIVPLTQTALLMPSKETILHDDNEYHERNDDSRRHRWFSLGPLRSLFSSPAIMDKTVDVQGDDEVDSHDSANKKRSSSRAKSLMHRLSSAENASGDQDNKKSRTSSILRSRSVVKDLLPDEDKSERLLEDDEQSIPIVDTVSRHTTTSSLTTLVPSMTQKDLLKDKKVSNWLRKATGANRKFTTSRIKNYDIDGANFDGERLFITSSFPRRHAQIRVSVYERLKTDLTRTRRLGVAMIPLSEVPVIMKNRQPDETFGYDEPDYRTRTLRVSGNSPNGTVSCCVWMTPMIREDVPPKVASWLAWLNAQFHAFCASKIATIGFIAGLICLLGNVLRFSHAYDVSFFLIPVLLVPLYLEYPNLLGSALSSIINLSVPNLRIRFGAIRFALWIDNTDANILKNEAKQHRKHRDKSHHTSASSPATRRRSVSNLHAAAKAKLAFHQHSTTDTSFRRRLAICLDINDFAIAHPPDAAFAHPDFVRAKNIRLHMSVDFRFFQSLLNLIWSSKQFNWSPFPTVHHAKRLGILDTGDMLTQSSSSTVDDLDGALFDDDPTHNKKIFERKTTIATTRESSKRQHVYAEVDPAFRIGAVRLDVLSVDDVVLAFDLADRELNLCRFVRELALGKVQAALPPEERNYIPNTINIKIIKADGVEIFGHAQEALYVKVSIRDFEHRTAKRALVCKTDTEINRQRTSVVWNEQHVLPCPDPSAVIHVGLYRSGGWGMTPTLVGQWLVTAKMLVLAPENVFVKDDDNFKTYRGDARVSDSNESKQSDRDKKKHRERAFVLEGSMRLRDKQLAGAIGAFDSENETTISLRIAYYHDSFTPSYESILKQRSLTALEQLQFNSLETQRKLGDMKLAINMLRDFPLLFDVRDIRFSNLNVYIKDLFTGLQGAEELTNSNTTSINSVRIDVVDRLTGSAARKKKNKNHVYLRRIDLGGRLGPRNMKHHHVEGLDLYTLTKNFVQAAVLPVVSEVDILGSLGQIFSGFLKGLSRAPWSGTQLPVSLPPMMVKGILRTTLADPTVSDQVTISDEDNDRLEGNREDREFAIDENDDPDEIIQSITYDDEVAVNKDDEENCGNNQSFKKDDVENSKKFAAAVNIINVKRHATNLRRQFQKRRNKRQWSQLSTAEMNMRKQIETPHKKGSSRRVSSVLPPRVRIFLQRKDSKLLDIEDQEHLMLGTKWHGYLRKHVVRFDSLFLSRRRLGSAPFASYTNSNKSSDTPKIVWAEVRGTTFFYTRRSSQDKSEAIGFTKKINLKAANLFARYDQMNHRIVIRLPSHEILKRAHQKSEGGDTSTTFRKELYFSPDDSSSSDSAIATLDLLWNAIAGRPPPSSIEDSDSIWYAL